MPVIFSQTPPLDPAALMVAYHHDERWLARSGFRDIRQHIWARIDVWLDEFADGFDDLARDILHWGDAWWLSRLSRLDARPWGQEAAFRPVCFARAVIELAETLTTSDVLYVVGAPLAVRRHAMEMAPDPDLFSADGGDRLPLAGGAGCRALLSAIKGGLAEAVALMRRHAFVRPARTFPAVIACHEVVGESAAEDAHRYFYGDVIGDAMPDGSIDYLALGVAGPSRTEAPGTFLLDWLSPWDVAACWIGHAYRTLQAWLALRRRPPLRFGGYVLTGFWQAYLGDQLSSVMLPRELAARRAMVRLMAQIGPRTILLPYEEKPLERALELAMHGAGGRIVGYAPHPQHALLAALRDRPGSGCPKPNAYAVCGPAYVDYFRNWANKDAAISVWGSAKQYAADPVVRRVPLIAPVRVLVLLSHPNELRLFGTWLDAAPGLTQDLQYLVRIYGAVGRQLFQPELDRIRVRHPVVDAVGGTLRDNVAQSDVSLFCATSAGIEAINLGALAVHVELNEGFSINPCFGRLAAMLSCATAVELSRCFERLRGDDAETLAALHDRQKMAAAELFSPLSADQVVTTLADG